jgi:hypothetical protein
MSTAAPNPNDPPVRGPDCWQCQHFGLTYDVRLPYLCRLMGIRTRILPAIEVLRADGRFCRGHVPRQAPAA